LDLAGRVKFGPDIQWITDPTDYSVNEANLDDVYTAVTQYLPNIDRSALAGDYTGIRYNHWISVFVIDFVVFGVWDLVCGFWFVFSVTFVRLQFLCFVSSLPLVPVPGTSGICGSVLFISSSCSDDRPKLGPKGSEFQDFIIRMEEGFPGFVNLLGIESPGLTSSLAIAEEVDSLVKR
jgi:hypothetical protein